MDVQTKLTIGPEEIEQALRSYFNIGLNSDFTYDVVDPKQDSTSVVVQTIEGVSLAMVRVTVFGEYQQPPADTAPSKKPNSGMLASDFDRVR